MAADAEDDIVACGDALRTVAGWLGVADVESVLQKEGLDVEYEAGRQQGLGLGAKYLPHNKAVALTSGVEHRLSSKLKRTAERRAAEQGKANGEAYQHSSHSGFQHAGFQQRPGKAGWQDRAGHQQRQQHHQQQQQTAGGGDQEDSSDGEEGRGGAFGKGKAAAQRPATYSRSDLLMGSEVKAGKKRKRRKGGGQGGGEGGGLGAAT